MNGTSIAQDPTGSRTRATAAAKDLLTRDSIRSSPVREYAVGIRQLEEQATPDRRGPVVTPNGAPSMNVGPENSVLTAANLWIKGINAFLYPGETPIEIDPEGNTRSGCPREGAPAHFPSDDAAAGYRQHGAH